MIKELNEDNYKLAIKQVCVMPGLGGIKSTGNHKLDRQAQLLLFGDSLDLTPNHNRVLVVPELETIQLEKWGSSISEADESLKRLINV